MNIEQGGWQHIDLAQLLHDADQLSGTAWLQAALMQRLVREARRRLEHQGCQVERSEEIWLVTRHEQTLRMTDRQLIQGAIAVEATQAQLKAAVAVLTLPTITDTLGESPQQFADGFEER